MRKNRDSYTGWLMVGIWNMADPKEASKRPWLSVNGGKGVMMAYRDAFYRE